MKIFSATTLLLLILSHTAYCQSTPGVGIGTSGIAPGSALQIDSNSGGLVQPRMTTAEMNAIPTPLDGALIYNTTENNWFIYKSGSWQTFVQFKTASVILNRNFTTNSFVITNTNTITPFPLNQSNVLANNTSFYELSMANGEIRILRDGTYIISAGFSTDFLSSGSHNYILQVDINGSRALYISNGNVDLPFSNYWGTSGNTLLVLNAGDIISIGYRMKYDWGSPGSSYSRDALFFNIGVSRL